MTEPTRHHEHKKCRQLLGSLSEYVDGELDEELCSVLEQHMEDCEDCRVVVDTLRKTVYLYHATATSEEIPSDIRKRLYKSLNIEEYLDK
ncbi:MAG TPA: anti-sigma factor [Anaerolineales bacterium]|nr:anti-sigma factor [Anaerolineales bacterium]